MSPQRTSLERVKCSPAAGRLTSARTRVLPDSSLGAPLEADDRASCPGRRCLQSSAGRARSRTGSTGPACSVVSVQNWVVHENRVGKLAGGGPLTSHTPMSRPSGPFCQRWLVVRARRAERERVRGPRRVRDRHHLGDRVARRGVREGDRRIPARCCRSRCRARRSCRRRTCRRSSRSAAAATAATAVGGRRRRGRGRAGRRSRRGGGRRSRRRRRRMPLRRRCRCRRSRRSSW